jgi:hypothetical protein
MKMRFNSGLYNLKALRRSIKDYAEIADMAVATGDDGYFEVEVKEIKDERLAGLLADEFCNYALHQTIEEKKKW